VKLNVAKLAGFCFGVRRAVDLAMKEISKCGKKNIPLYSLGPLIHNPQEVKRLEREGIKIINNIYEAKKEGHVIVRTHGVHKSIWEKAKKYNIKLIDGTCPLVKKAQDFIELLYQEGYTIVLLGEQRHAEVKALSEYTENKAFVVKGLDDFKKINFNSAKKIGFISQTTQSIHNFRKVLLELLGKALELRVFNTICGATLKRQKEALKLAKKSEVMVVVGGYNSANTKELVEVCRNSGTITYHVETAKDLLKKKLFGFQSLGLTAGASTPDWVIEEVLAAIKKKVQK
jgi:4-hydroxy-3-methylbut-2-enyl diphosphate reductase